jgi:transcriptional regulator with XRE-family HTH domain
MAPSEESDKLIAELRAWCGREHGRGVQIAKQLGTSRQRVSDWLAGRKSPTLEQGLKLQAFLQKQRRAKPRDPALKVSS